MSDVDDKNLTDIITLRGKKISQFDEINEVANQAQAYILITVRLDEDDDDDEPIYVNQKISLENFLHVLLGDDSGNMIERFNRFFNDSTISLSSYMTNNNETNPISYLEKTDGKFHLHLETLNAEYVLNPETREKLFSDGIIDQDVLQRYVGDTVDEVTNEINTRIDSEISNVMRYINLDEDDVIDTLQEIINWFDNWRRNDDNLTSLIETIETYGESYTNQKIQELRNELSASINSMNVSTIGGDGQIITSVSQNSGRISATSTPVSSLEINVNQIDGLDDALSQIQNLGEGTNIDIDENNNINCTIEVDDENNSFKINSTTEYSLHLVGNKLQILQYTELTVTDNSTQYFEPDSGQQTITLSSTASGTNDVTSDGWSTSTSGYSVTDNARSGKTFTATGKTKTDNTNGSFKITIHQIDPAKDKSTTVSVSFTKYRVWCFQTTDGSYQVTLQNNKPTNLPNVFYNQCHSSDTTFSANSQSNGFIYILMPSTWTKNNFYFGSPLNEQKAVKQTLTIYSSPGVGYTLYRSDQPLGQILFEYTKK